MTEAPDALAPEPGDAATLSAADDVLADAAAQVDALEADVDMTPLDRSRRMLLVHAHPDDETIGTGATMARYAAEHTLVTLVTCTLGEEGEIVVPELAHLASDRGDDLGRHRIEELAVACEALGVTDHRFLGGPGRWRDSGMMGTPPNDDPRCLWQADLDQAILELVRVVREVRPHVVITYDENGGYGHPDHIRAHQITVAAVEAAADPAYARDGSEPWQVAKLYATALPRSVIQQGIEHFREAGGDSGFLSGVASADEVPFAVPDELVTTRIDAREHLAAKVAALRAHRTQISVDGPFFALADGVGQETFGVEHYRLLRGDLGSSDGEREDDLFAGLPT
jgi:N-acetyl-1-D-myo-inositol-2-amino-2-deoxy-alpha-D-glucopyranoside deacetylase